MTISTIKKDLIYGVIILILGGLVYYEYRKPPAIVTQTLTKVVNQVQTVEKVVTKDRIVYVDRKIVTHKKDGDVVVETDHEHSATDTSVAQDTQTHTTTTLHEQTVTGTLAHYSVEYMFSPIKDATLDPHPNLGNSVVGAGVRILDTPIWAVGQIQDSGKTYSVGLRYEW